MNWINVPSGLAIVLSIIVFLQGWSILWEALWAAERDEAGRLIGSLTVSLAVLGMMIVSLFLSTEIVFSPEFGVVIIQGQWACFFFILCLVSAFLSLSWGWDLARLRAGWEPRGIRMHLLSILVCLFSISMLFQRANAPTFDAAPIYLYDLWWPILPLWITIGFTDISLTILRDNRPVVRSAAALFMAFLVSLVVLTYKLFFKPLPDFAHPWTLWVWIAALPVLLIAILVQTLFQRKETKARSQGDTTNALRRQFQRLKDAAREIEREQILLLVALSIIAFGFVRLIFSSSLAGPAWGVILVLLGWGIMTEIVTDGWFQKLYLDLKNGKWLGPIDKASTKLRSWRKDTGEQLGKILSFPPNWTAIVKLLLLVALLTVLNEALNYRKTIIQPFQAIGFDDTASLVTSVDDRLINDLAQLNQQLQLAIPLPTSAHTEKIRFVQASSAASSFDAVLTNSGEFELGAIKIPANVIVGPLQGLVRPWFRIRVVGGHVISEQDGFILVVNASNGDTWIAQATKIAQATNEQALASAIPELAKQLSFGMIISEESLQSFGITRDWRAFGYFQQGWEQIQIYESKEDLSALMSAIQYFGAATREDPKFALAHYYLGLALQQYRQPWQAEQAFRTALLLNPDSIPFKNVLAYHLYFYDNYAPSLPAVVPGEASDRKIEKRRIEALQLWHQITSRPYTQVPMGELASAYSGLCHAGIADADPNFRNDTFTYFYCYKSQNLLSRLPNSPQSREKIRQAEAENLINLGFVVDRNSPVGVLTRWNCLAMELSAETGTLPESISYGFSSAGLQYYKKAIALRPQDPFIQCNAAINSELIGEHHLMDNLEQSAQAHYDVARRYFEKARSQSSTANKPSAFYEAAIREYKKAINRDGMYHPALNEYAYTYWVFRLQWPQESVKLLGTQFHETLPEYFAREALRLARLQENDDLEVRYASTLAEVLIANGNPQAALDTLLELKTKIPDSYMFDEVRWDLAQAALCSIRNGKKEFSKQELEKLAQGYLKEIENHEKMLESRLLSRWGEDWLTTSYRVPFSFCNP